MRLPLLLLLVAGSARCVQAQGTPMPDFRLKDENPNSPRYRSDVSPRDYRLQISAYYFGGAG